MMFFSFLFTAIHHPEMNGSSTGKQPVSDKYEQMHSIWSLPIQRHSFNRKKVCCVDELMYDHLKMHSNADTRENRV